MAPCIISADSTFDMPPSMISELGISVIASYVRLGDKTYDDTKVDFAAMMQYHESTGKLPQTAAANISDYADYFEALSRQGLPVVHIAKSSGMSSCYNNAVVAAEDFKNIYVVDSKNIGGGSAMVAMYAAANRDLPAEALVERLNAYREEIIGGFVIEQLDFLYKGGRCSALALLGANTLKIRPSLRIEDGVMGLGKKYRGSYKKCLLTYIDEQLADLSVIDPSVLFVNGTVVSPELQDELMAYIEGKHIFERIIYWPAGAAVSVHCGPNTFGFFYHKK